MESSPTCNAGGGSSEGDGGSERGGKRARVDHESSEEKDAIVRTARQLLDDVDSIRSSLFEHSRSINDCLAITEELRELLSRMHASVTNREAWIASERAALLQMQQHWLEHMTGQAR